MPIVAMPVFGFALGAGLAWATARALASSVQSLAARAVLIVALMALLGYAPAQVFIVTLAPAWSFGYFVAPEHIPGWCLPLFALAVAASVPLGFGTALRAARGREAAFPKRWLFVPALLGVLLLGPGVPRLGAFASFAQFHGDYGVQPLVGGVLGYALVWTLVGLSAVSFCTYRALSILAAIGRDAA
jgi:hypothetical protein